jgi:uncharacterized zinc-type alcohol dehydrogenase-like protein
MGVPYMADAMIQGYAALSVGGSLEPFTYEKPKLGEYDVRVSVSHCGLCHTDIQAVDNYYGITNFPFVPGHEIVGHVSEIGPEVCGLRLGDRVGIGWQGRSCGACEWCAKGETQLCMDIEETTVMKPYGGFSSPVMADYRFVHPLPAGLPSEDGAVLMCAGLTAYSALCTHLTTPGLKLAVVGIGGLGHLAIQFARAFGCHVTAISSSRAKIEQAFSFGAEQFIDANDESSMRDAAFDFDLLLCTANAGFHWESLLSALKKRGKLILLGFPDVAFNSTDLVAHELTLVGSLIGNPSMMRAMLTFAQEHGIKPVVELMPMSRVNEAIDKVMQNRARYRIVLVNADKDQGIYEN